MAHIVGVILDYNHPSSRPGWPLILSSWLSGPPTADTSSASQRSGHEAEPDRARDEDEERRHGTGQGNDRH